MKKRDITELHTKTEAELMAQVKELRSLLADAKLDHASQKLSNTRSIANMRADIARILTVLQTKTTQEVASVEGGKGK